MRESSFAHVTGKHAATISSSRRTFLRFYCGVFIILLFPELSPSITMKYFQWKLSCIVEDDEKLTHIWEAEQFSVFADRQQRSNCFRKPVKIAGFFPWHSAGNWLEWATGSVFTYKKWCHIINYLLTSLPRDGTGEYWPSFVFARMSLRFGPCCHDLGPIFPSTALAFS